MNSVRKKALLKILVGGIGYALVFWAIYENGISESDARGGVFRLMAMMAPALPMLMGLVELLFNAPFSEVSARWDALKGWQRGVFGVLVIVLAFALMIGVFLTAVFTGIL